MTRLVIRSDTKKATCRSPFIIPGERRSPLRSDINPDVVLKSF